MSQSHKYDPLYTSEKGIRLNLEEIHIHNGFMQHCLKCFPEIRTFEDQLKGDLVIPVDAHDIADAEQGNPAKCAVALAAQRHIQGVTGALINKRRSIVIFDRTRAVRFHTPMSTYAMLHAFDLGGKVEPGAFTLKPVHKRDYL